MLRTAGALSAFAAALAMPVIAQEEDARTVITHAGTLMANASASPMTEQSMVIIGDKIEAIEAGYVERDGAEIIDLKDEFALPRLFDSHAHMASQLGSDARLLTVENSDADWTLLDALFVTCPPPVPWS